MTLNSIQCGKCFNLNPADAANCIRCGNPLSNASSANTAEANQYSKKNEPFSGFAVGQVYAEKYELTRFVGNGGMGEVWLATQSKIGRQVAIKFMHPELMSHQTARLRVLSEAKALGKLAHPNVVQIFDYFETEATVALVLAYVEGGSVADRVEQRGKMKHDEAVQIMQGMLEGLQALHDAGLVHRDIKPDNVLLGFEKGSVVAKITDLGIAHQEEGTRLTRDGSRLGTLEYMAPEQIKNGQTSIASDIYSCGIMLFEMLTGTVPFTGSDYDILDGHVRGDVDFRRLPSTTPIWLHNVLRCAIAKSPEERFSSAALFLESLVQKTHPEFMADHPVNDTDQALKENASHSGNPEADDDDDDEFEMPKYAPSKSNGGRLLVITGVLVGIAIGYFSIVGDTSDTDDLSLPELEDEIAEVWRPKERVLTTGPSWCKNASSATEQLICNQATPFWLLDREAHAAYKAAKNRGAFSKACFRKLVKEAGACSGVPACVEASYFRRIDYFSSIAMGESPTCPSQGAQLNTTTKSRAALGIVMKKIPSGSYSIGSLRKVGYERGQKQIRLSRSFSISETEITERQWKGLMGGLSATSSRPKVHLTWLDAVRFTNRLNATLGLPSCFDDAGNALGLLYECKGYRLPTEAEWEVAAAGSVSVIDAAGGYTSRQVVASGAPNQYGLYDMLGNVFEWSADQLRSVQGDQGALDPLATGGSLRVGRGGNYRQRSSLSRTTTRVTAKKTYQDDGLGFRIARTVP